MENITDKKKAIFESTLDLIKDHGFHGTPMSLVAKNAGVAAGTIYHYFQSKDELICELHQYNKAQVIELIEDTLADDIPYRQKFFNIWNNMYSFYTRNSNVLIFYEQFLNSPYNVNKSPDYLQGPLLRFFMTGIENKILKLAKPETLMLLTLGSITSVAKMNVFGKIHFGPRDIEQVVEVLWDGMSVHSRK